MRTRWIYAGPRSAWERRDCPGEWLDPSRRTWVSRDEDVQVVRLGEGPWPEVEELRAEARRRGVTIGVSRG
jgi:hypothetical protein